MLEPSPWISRFADQVPRQGAVLDVACGGGRHARFFLNRGHPVTAIDRDVSKLNQQENLEIIQHDLEDGSPWPLNEKGSERRFSAVVVVNYLYRPLLPRLVASVGQGGVLLYDTFAVGNEAFVRPSNPEFLLRPDELLETVSGELEVLDYFNGRTDGAKPAMRQSICARRN
ncbi:MAG: class I SAM-dependent methyltransferase [Alphaproteobacteria bacterium]|nr:class I SAM-dependent methyltransferase [Alphaproteobacteria bacterium]